MIVTAYIDKRPTAVAISVSLVLHVCLLIGLTQYKTQQPQKNITESLNLQVMLFSLERQGGKPDKITRNEELNRLVEPTTADSKAYPIRHGVKRSSTDNQSTLVEAVKESGQEPYAASTVENAVLPAPEITEKNATPAIPLPSPARSMLPESNIVQSGRPDYAYNPAPEYPILLREQGISGTVWVKVWVGSDGHPGAISLIKGSGYRLLDESALNAVRNWRFIPARNAEQTLASWVEFPIRFVLKS